MTTLIIIAGLIAFIILLVVGVHKLDFRDDNLKDPCPECGGEVFHVLSKELDGIGIYQCKACGNHDFRNRWGSSHEFP